MNGGIKSKQETKTIFDSNFNGKGGFFMQKDTFDGKKSFLTDSDFSLSSPFDLREGQKSLEHADRFQAEGQILSPKVKNNENS